MFPRTLKTVIDRNVDIIYALAKFEYLGGIIPT